MKTKNMYIHDEHEDIMIRGWSDDQQLSKYHYLRVKMIENGSLDEAIDIRSKQPKKKKVIAELNNIFWNRKISFIRNEKLTIPYSNV